MEPSLRGPKLAGPGGRPGKEHMYAIGPGCQRYLARDG